MEEIYRVNAEGGAFSLLQEATKPTFAFLAFDAQENLIAGSDGSGLIYRILPQARIRVVQRAQEGNHSAGARS